MGYPFVNVALGFNSGPYVASPTFTDVTEYVQEVTTRRGRSDELAEFDSGTATITLSNHDRRFDPLNSSSPYNGFLVPRVPISITARAFDQRTNLITNPSFETNTTGWSGAAGATLTRTSAQAFVGSWSVTSARIAATGAMVVGFAPRLPVTAGLAYTFSAYFRRDYSTTRVTQLRLQWFNAGGTLIGSTIIVGQTPPAVNTWGRFSITQTAPVGTATVYIDIIVNSAIVGENIWVDGAMLEQSSTLGTYFDGSTTGYAWNGTPNASTSSTFNYPIFRGYVNGWPVSITDAGYNNTVTLECFDLMGLLEQEELPDDLADSYIRSLNPRHYWPLNDPIDPVTYTSQSLADYGNSPVPLTAYSSFKTANCEGLAIGLANTAVSIAETDFVDGWSYSRGPYSSAAASLSLWFQAPQLDQLTVASWGSQCDTNISYDVTSSTLEIQVLSGTTLGTFVGTIALDLSIAHHLVVNMNNSIAAPSSVYVDGQPLTMSLSSSVAFSASLFESYSSGQGRRQQIVTLDRALTATEIETIYRLSRAIITETTAARFQRLINYTSLPASAYITPTGTVGTVSGITTGGPSLTSELQLLNDSEGGSLFVNKAGQLLMTSRNAFATGTSLTSQATIGTTGITIGPEISYHLDAETMRNQLTMGFAGEGTVEVENATSVAAYGANGGTWSTQLSSQEQALQLANLVVGFSKDPKVVISPVEVNVSAVDADWVKVLGLELLERYTLALAPAVGSAINVPQLVQSIEHRVIPGEWSTTLNGSTRYTNPFIIGSSLLGGTDLIL